MKSRKLGISSGSNYLGLLNGFASIGIWKVSVNFKTPQLFSSRPVLPYSDCLTLSSFVSSRLVSSRRVFCTVMSRLDLSVLFLTITSPYPINLLPDTRKRRSRRRAGPTRTSSPSSTFPRNHVSRGISLQSVLHEVGLSAPHLYFHSMKAAGPHLFVFS